MGLMGTAPPPRLPRDATVQASPERQSSREGMNLNGDTACRAIDAQAAAALTRAAWTRCALAAGSACVRQPGAEARWAMRGQAIAAMVGSPAVHR